MRCCGASERKEKKKSRSEESEEDDGMQVALDLLAPRDLKAGEKQCGGQGNIDRLIGAVASNAILNAGGRGDEVRCYPGTREEVVGKIEKWMDGQGEPCHRMMWLSGPAGAGKSAITQTVAERCKKHGIHTANFFFFRGDWTRNHAQPLVATLVYQLRGYYHTLDELLAECLMATPLICEASIDEQFTQLISSPIHMVQQSPSIQRPIILIIDGLDECEDKKKEQQILGALRTLIQEDDSPFIVLVASRAEPHLVMSFNKLGTLVGPIFLNNKYTPRDDIHHFVTSKSDEIKGAHHLAHTLDSCWPAETDLDAITDKSSASPALSLLRVHEMQQSTGSSPFPQLDAVYFYIFSKADDIQTIKLIIGAHFIIQNTTRRDNDFHQLLQLVGYKTIDIHSLFADLAPIAQVISGPPIQLVFYHASLSDYLRDKSRSGIYHINVEELAPGLSTICLQKFHNEWSFILTDKALELVKEANTELSKSLLDASTQNFSRSFKHFAQYEHYWEILIVIIARLYFTRDKALFKRMLQA
ncbi:hypothetical protein D9619_012009 [Psilocybe cf. subviscida]|uniref:NACHT domain-containing protein n=1 Tax=Psilocybe cf. subviscida TaxID=2480587 RepID=A0A8H5B0D0_9AGAR|nr:hypothetical protein D9619_012009 [Psilocybe cf. subviscida]